MATTLFALTSGAALATVVGVLTDVAFMLLIFQFCKVTRNRFFGQPVRL